jgi:hypothetical protein
MIKETDDKQKAVIARSLKCVQDGLSHYLTGKEKAPTEKEILACVKDLIKLFPCLGALAKTFVDKNDKSVEKAS